MDKSQSTAHSVLKLISNRPIMVCMIFSAILLAGILAFIQTPVELLPAIERPELTIVLSLPGKLPTEIEEILNKLEGVVGRVTGVVEINALSEIDRGVLHMRFQEQIAMNEALFDVRRVITEMDAGLIPYLHFYQYSPNALPVMYVGLTGADPAQLSELAESLVVPQMMVINGIAAAEVIGNTTPQIVIRASSRKLERYSLQLSQIKSQINRYITDISAGSVAFENQKLPLIIKTVPETIESLGSIPLKKLTPTSDVLLQDIGTIEQEDVTGDTFCRIDGKPAVLISITRASFGNALKIEELVRKKVAEIRQTLPSSMNIEIAFNRAAFIRLAMDELKSVVWVGALLAALVVYVFLRRFGVTVIISISIPISIIATFILLRFGGLSLNLMTLGGLALGAGMLVDNAIVVMESIERRRQELIPEPYVAGVMRIAVAVIASTVTTLVIFVPIVYIHGPAAQFFSHQALTVSFSLTASLIVSYLLIPTLARLIGGKQQGSALTKSDTWMRTRYEQFLRLCLRRPYLVLAIVILLIIGSLGLLPKIDRAFLPDYALNQFSVILDLPPGTDITVTNSALQRLESVLSGNPLIAKVTSIIGTLQDSLNPDEVVYGGANRARLFVELKEARRGSTKHIRELLEQAASGIPNAQLKIASRSEMLPFLADSEEQSITLELRGSNVAMVRDFAETVAGELRKIPIFASVQGIERRLRTELELRPKTEAMSRWNLDNDGFQRAIEGILEPAFVRMISIRNQQLQVKVGLVQNEITNEEQLGAVSIALGESLNVRLKQLVDFQKIEGETARPRRDRKPVEILTIRNKENRKEAMRLLQERLRQIPNTYGIEMNIRGEQEAMATSFKGLLLAGLLSIVLVYMVLACLFESVTLPLIILCSIPFAILGVTPLLFLLGHSFNVLSLIGIIMLIGIVVNNAIVLVDNLHKQIGFHWSDAGISAVSERLRPILMTSGTTIVGLLPMALGLGQGGELRAPIAVPVIGGLCASSLFTLIVIPIIYFICTKSHNDATDN